MPANKWYNLKVKMKEDKIQCRINDKLVFEATDKAFQNAGNVGLWTKSDAVTYFDDFVTQ